MATKCIKLYSNREVIFSCRSDDLESRLAWVAAGQAGDMAQLPQRALAIWSEGACRCEGLTGRGFLEDHRPRKVAGDIP
jgi:hypothetical protein